MEINVPHLPPLLPITTPVMWCYFELNEWLLSLGRIDERQTEDSNWPMDRWWIQLRFRPGLPIFQPQYSLHLSIPSNLNQLGFWLLHLASQQKDTVRQAIYLCSVVIRLEDFQILILLTFFFFWLSLKLGQGGRNSTAKIEWCACMWTILQQRYLADLTRSCC